MRIWRISEFRDLKGRGGLIASARWHTMGRPIVYLADHPAGAMLERLVHLYSITGGKLPRNYTLLEIEADDQLAIDPLSPPAGPDWRERHDTTRSVGDRWLASASSALARVPSAVVPKTWNYLLNPLHPDAAAVSIISEIRETFDSRLFVSRPH